MTKTLLSALMVLFIAFLSGIYVQSLITKQEDRYSIQPYIEKAKAIKKEADSRASARIADEKAKAILAKATSEADVERAKTISPRVVPMLTPDSVANLVRNSTEYAFGSNEWIPMYELLMRESGFNPWAFNKSSGACGIFQALPCSKMGGMEIETQIDFGISYIKSRYGLPSKALSFHDVHGWY